MSDVPLNVQESDISSNLNSIILSILLMGMYTVIYFGTVYLYFTRIPSKNHLVIGAITMLYLSSIFQTGVQWFETKWQFVDNGDTRESVYLSLSSLPGWTYIAIAVSNCISYVIAGGIFIWRCFYLWNRSLRVISVPLLFIVTEFALFLAKVSFSIKYGNHAESQALESTIDNVSSAAYFMSFATTLVITTLIAYRIHSVSNQEGASSSQFKYLIDIVVQSGMIFAFSQFTTAISSVVPGANTVKPRNIAFEEYSTILNFAIAGMSPTIMVAWDTLLSADTTLPSTSAQLSGLQFHGRSTHPTVNIGAMQTIYSVDGDQISAGEEQAIEEKAQ